MKHIKEIRQNLGISRREFSEIYEIPYNTLAQWEREERCAPGYVIKLIEEIIKLKTKREQLTIEDTAKKAYLHYNNNELCYVYENEEEAKKWKSFSTNVCKVHNVKIFEIEYTITKEI